jgi:hypothetical protein
MTQPLSILSFTPTNATFCWRYMSHVIQIGIGENRNTHLIL